VRSVAAWEPPEWCQETSSAETESFLRIKHSAYLRRLVRVDERTPTADLVSLRVISMRCRGLRIPHV